MPVLPDIVWFPIAFVGVALIVMVVEATIYIRAASALYLYIRRKLPQEWRDMPMLIDDPHEMVFPPDARLAAIVEGVRGLRTDDADYKKQLRTCRIHIAIFAVAFSAGLIALGMLLRIPATCCQWGVFALS